MNKITIFVGLTALIMVLAACSPAQDFPDQTVPEEQNQDTEEREQAPQQDEETTGEEAREYVPLEEREIETLSDGRKYIVHPDKIRGGGPPKDGIPSIDNPKYVSVQEADEWIQDNELILAIEHEGVTRAYPLQILVYHEIVNDEIAGDPILITYCPLCGSGIAYERKIDGEAVEFGTSGKLYNSNLVMYDRKTDTYWSQIDGIAILGELTGQELEPVPIDTVSWGDWKQSHQDAEVLSLDTGYSRPYGQDPYGTYYEESNLFFPVENQDERIHAKDVVFGIKIDGDFKAYTQEAIDREGTITDEFNGVQIKVVRNDDGTITFTRQDTGEELAKERDFWFAWYAFHPGTELYQ